MALENFLAILGGICQLELRSIVVNASGSSTSSASEPSHTNVADFPASKKAPPSSFHSSPAPADSFCSDLEARRRSRSSGFEGYRSLFGRLTIRGRLGGDVLSTQTTFSSREQGGDEDLEESVEVIAV